MDEGLETKRLPVAPGVAQETVRRRVGGPHETVRVDDQDDVGGMLDEGHLPAGGVEHSSFGGDPGRDVHEIRGTIGLTEGVRTGMPQTSSWYGPSATEANSSRSPSSRRAPSLPSSGYSFRTVKRLRPIKLPGRSHNSASS